MKKLIFTLIVITTIFGGHAQEVTVFKSGEDGYKSYRIPAMVKNKNGDIIAFSEGRVDHAGDYGNVNIVYKISKDNGKTWGALQVAAKNEKLQAGNPAPVVDVYDPVYPEGRIFLFYNTGNNHEGEVRKGNGLRELWYITSTDGGQSWSQPVNITTQGHRPNQPNINSDYNFKEDWRAFANTPGHAVQLGDGPYKGRIYIPSNHSEGNPKDAGRDYFANAYYSDDHGQTFKIAETIPFEGGNETMAAQVSDTELYMNTRNQQGNIKSRIVSYSSDGGATWDTTTYDLALPDPVNQGSTLSWKDGSNYILAVCNAADEQKRDNLTVRLSRDKGKTWFFNKVIAKSPEGYKGDYSAYSDLVLLGTESIGVLYEKDNYKSIVFVPISITE
ncbi:sialidase family protein [Sphingobacterium sp. UT-1RO-CII-1]|uniref:sialidase family protein n=1 Tax=Sphingobacterium sp. UT-1RO-CII-1 TaxID=2995225 RepID=UPI00227A568D|nr:sialidase family protein [Sphingobacterium sp. UT-1RO-CII-1]MCY4779761.1 sialidase family protein [Sphingobacterium sp. UT-1RO-CII-1]